MIWGILSKYVCHLSLKCFTTCILNASSSSSRRNVKWEGRRKHEKREKQRRSLFFFFSLSRWTERESEKGREKEKYLSSKVSLLRLLFPESLKVSAPRVFSPPPLVIAFFESAFSEWIPHFLIPWQSEFGSFLLQKVKLKFNQWTLLMSSL